MVERTQISPGYMSSMWNFFASVKLTVVVLLSLAVLSSIGTLIPQNQSPEEYFRAFGAFRYQVLSTLDIFDMYHSWWFQFLILLLVANIVICSIDRLRITGKIIFVKTPKFNLKSFRQRKTSKNLNISADIDSARATYQKIIARRFGYCKVIDTDSGFAVTAEKGRWTRLGVYSVHLSVVLLLVGGLLGSILGFEGYANVGEG